VTEDGSVVPRRLLGRFGVSEAAEAVWRVLLADADATIEDIASRIPLTSTAIAPTIQELLDAGLVRGGNSPTGVVTIDPSLAVETHIVRAERAIAVEVEGLAALRAQIPALVDEQAHGRSAAADEPGFEIVTAVADIRRQLYLAAERAHGELRSIDHAPGPHNFEDGRAAQFALLARGVRDRTILATQSLADPVLLAEYAEMHARGHLARALPNVTTRLLIYDRDLAVLPVDPYNMPLGAIFIRVPSVINAMILMYDYMWSAATPVFTTTSDDEAPTGRRARILELLAVGTKDERIARTLGVGVRTIRRDVAELKSTLGVSSRAEIAAAAIRRDWL
jgi:DNA-binding CsgD family transcriptional regulator